jgi:hypothetical protein
MGNRLPSPSAGILSKMTNAKLPDSLRDFDDVAAHPGVLGCTKMGLSFRPWNTPGGADVRYHRPVRVADAPKKGRVVRIERPSKARPKPPGLGAFTEEQLQDWYRSHPKAKMKFVDMVNGKRTQDDRFSPDAIWVRGYFYAITRVTGSSGTEVWLNDEGEGKVIGIERELP